jgi:uncharacterized protein YxeA
MHGRKNIKFILIILVIQQINLSFYLFQKGNFTLIQRFIKHKNNCEADSKR